MRKIAVLLAAWLVLTGAAFSRAAQNEPAPLPRAEPVAGAPEVVPLPKMEAPAIADAGGTVVAAPCVVSECADCCPCQKCRRFGCARRLWDWLTYRPAVCRSPHCCVKGCACCCPPVYTFFYCTCIPKNHLPYPPFIGQGQPAVKRCCGDMCDACCN